MKKEYKNRHDKPLVNPAVTYGEWQEKQAVEGFKSYLDKYGPTAMIEDSENKDLDYEQACGE